jgi:hypothetical protein
MLAERANSAAAKAGDFKFQLRLGASPERIAWLEVYASRYRQQRGLPPPGSGPASLAAHRCPTTDLAAPLGDWLSLTVSQSLPGAELRLAAWVNRLPSTDTPAERAQLSEVLPEASRPIQTLLVEYQLVTYALLANLASPGCR